MEIFQVMLKPCVCPTPPQTNLAHSPVSPVIPQGMNNSHALHFKKCTVTSRISNIIHVINMKNNVSYMQMDNGNGILTVQGNPKSAMSCYCCQNIILVM